MSSRAPRNARELFGAYADVREAAVDDVERSSRASTGASSSSLWESRQTLSFGPFTRWDSEDLGRVLVVNVFDGLKSVDEEALARLALDEREHAPGMRVSNIGGYHGTPDVFARRNDATSSLRRAVEEACKTVWIENEKNVKKVMIKKLMGAGDPASVSTSWVNVCESSHGHGLHNHVNAVWSGVYYASTGKTSRESENIDDDRDEPGDLLIRVTAGGFDASLTEPSGYCYYARVKPKVGRLVVFPSWVLHGVLASTGTDSMPRISYAFNTGELGVKFDESDCVRYE